MSMIEEKRAKYQTFKKSRLRFLVDRQYRPAFNEYRSKLEVSMGRVPPPWLTVKPPQQPTSTSAPPTLAPKKTVVPTDPRKNHLQTLASAVAKSELSTGGEACWDCMKRHNDVPELGPLLDAKGETLDDASKTYVNKYKNHVKKADHNGAPPSQFDYKFTVDGIHHLQDFLRIYHDQLCMFSRDERNLPEIFREFGYHLARATVYKSVYSDEWAFLRRQPMCMALRTLLTKNRQVLVTCREKPVFQSFMRKILPIVKSLEQPRKGICGGCAGNLKKPNERDAAANALLFLATSDYSSDGSA